MLIINDDDIYRGMVNLYNRIRIFGAWKFTYGWQ